VSLASAAQWSRACWAAGEPYTVNAFFTEEAVAAVTAAGLPTRATYIVLRSAPMGSAHPAVVTSAFHSFPASTIDAVLPDAWNALSPQHAVAATHDSVSAAARRRHPHMIGDPRVTEIADRLQAALVDLDTSGRPLAAANRAVPPPDEPWARLWRGLNTVREHRGDTHISVLTAEGLEVVEAEVLMSAWAGSFVDTPRLRRTRSISDEAWAAASERLVARDLLDPADAGVTAAGRTLRDHIEYTTDAGSAAIWDCIGADNTRMIWDFLRDLSEQLLGSGQMRAVTPVGAPWPPPAPRVPS
jgi:hypothetical protein